MQVPETFLCQGSVGVKRNLKKIIRNIWVTLITISCNENDKPKTHQQYVWYAIGRLFDDMRFVCCKLMNVPMGFIAIKREQTRGSFTQMVNVSH